MQARDIFGLEGLAELGSRNGIDMRPTLLRVLTDLYVHRLKHTAAEERHYTELALRLLETVDLPTRVAVARRFARYLSPPLRVMQWLARDLPEVAAELRWHPLLQTPAPVETAAPSAAAPNPTDQEQSSNGAMRVVDVATAGELNEIFLTADPEERRLILVNLDIVTPVTAGSVQVSRDPAHGRRLEAAALTGRAEDFARLLAQALHITHEQARRVVRDDSGEAVVVAAKALGMAREVLYRILMFLNPAVGHSVERVHALAALYEALTPPAAEGMVAIWQALHASERASVKHQPLAADDEIRRPMRPATATRRRSAETAKRSLSNGA